MGERRHAGMMIATLRRGVCRAASRHHSVARVHTIPRLCVQLHVGSEPAVRQICHIRNLTEWAARLQPASTRHASISTKNEEDQARMPPPLVLASWGRRLLALLFDGVLFLGNVALAAWGSAVVGQVLHRDVAVSTCLCILAVMCAPGVLYYKWNGQTPGKRLFRIRCVREDGCRMGLKAAFADHILKVCTNMPPYGVLLGMLGCFGDHKALHNY